MLYLVVASPYALAQSANLKSHDTGSQAAPVPPLPPSIALRAERARQDETGARQDESRVSSDRDSPALAAGVGATPARSNANSGDGESSVGVPSRVSVSSAEAVTVAKTTTPAVTATIAKDSSSSAIAQPDTSPDAKSLDVTITATSGGDSSNQLSGEKASLDSTEPLPLIMANIRFGTREGGFRIVLESDSYPQLKTKVLAKPNRLEVALQPTVFFVPSSSKRSMNEFVYGYEAGSLGKEGSQIVFDLASVATISRTFILEPDADNKFYRTVIDLSVSDQLTHDRLRIYKISAEGKIEASTREQLLRSIKLPVKNPQPNADENGSFPKAALHAAKLEEGAYLTESQLPVVVVDPGHGGVDPGALAENGLREKDITLQFSVKFGRALAETKQFEVYITRKHDTFVRLGDRVRAARSIGAEMFISIHADAAFSPETTGSTVYTLSETASDSLAQRVADRENNSDLLAGHGIIEVDDDLGEKILLDIAQRQMINRSVVLAQSMLASMSKVTPLNRRPHRTAGFHVLKTFDIPAVLVELGYLTNATDRARLINLQWQDNVVESLVRGVQQYFRAPNRPNAYGGSLAELDTTNLVLGLMNSQHQHGVSDFHIITNSISGTHGVHGAHGVHGVHGTNRHLHHGHNFGNHELDSHQ